jgi:hypothetical protein
MSFNWNTCYKLANKVMGTVKARYQYVARSLRHQRRRFTTCISDIDYTITGFVLVPVTKVPCGPRETVIFTWPVASCGNGCCFMPITNMCYQQRASARYLSWLICNTWSVMGALPVTKGNLHPLPKPSFHVVMPLMFKLGSYSYILLNLCLEPCSIHLGSKIHLPSWMFSLHATLWRSLSFFLPQRHFMYHA